MSQTEIFSKFITRNNQGTDPVWLWSKSSKYHILKASPVVEQAGKTHALRPTSYFYLAPPNNLDTALLIPHRTFPLRQKPNNRGTGRVLKRGRTPLDLRPEGIKNYPQALQKTNLSLLALKRDDCRGTINLLLLDSSTHYAYLYRLSISLQEQCNSAVNNFYSASSSTLPPRVYNFPIPAEKVIGSSPSR